jgi:hypothetical protein
MMNRCGRGLLVLTMAVLLLTVPWVGVPGVHAATDQLDQSQTIQGTLPDSSEPDYVAVYGRGSQVPGQTFTAGITGDLDRVSVLIATINFPKQDAAVQIYAVDPTTGLPTGSPLTYAGNTSPYTVDQSVSITCTAADQPGLSGLDPATNTCRSISGPAYALALGTITFAAQASDYAGNAGTGATSVSVTVTPPALCTLTERFERPATAAVVPCQLLNWIAVTSGTTRTALLRLYQTLIGAQSGHSLTAGQVTILVRLAGAL